MAANRTGVNIRPLEEYQREVRRHAREYKVMMVLVGDRYLNFAQKRYRRNSRGGGSWPKHAASTRRSRGRGKRSRRGFSGSERKHAILIVEGDLIGALQRGRAGNEFKTIKKGIRVGFSASARHPSGMSFRELAQLHEKGNPKGNLPAREILVEPDQSTKKTMIRIVKRQNERLGKRAEKRR